MTTTKPITEIIAELAAMTDEQGRPRFPWVRTECWCANIERRPMPHGECNEKRYVPKDISDIHLEDVLDELVRILLTVKVHNKVSSFWMLKVWKSGQIDHEYFADTPAELIESALRALREVAA